jgi:hypothetical protein
MISPLNNILFNWLLASVDTLKLMYSAFILLLRIRALPGLKNAEHRRIRANARPEECGVQGQAVGLDAEEPVNIVA